MIAIGSVATHLHPPQRTHVEVAESAEAYEFLESAYGVRLRLSEVRRDGDGVALSYTRTDVGPFAIEEVALPGSFQAAPDPMNKVIGVWTSGGRLQGRCDGMTAEAGAGEITLMSQPDLPHESSADELCVTSVLMDPGFVASVAVGVPAVDTMPAIRFSSFRPIDAVAGQRWKDSVGFVKNSVLAEDATATPLVIGQAARLLAAVTLSTFPNPVTAKPTPHDRNDHQPALLRRAIEFMDGNVANDIGLADIADAVHVTPRAVQYMFRRHLDTTPLQYLRRLRLHYAHSELVAADRMQETVTGIAVRWGFVHTGRFAVLYRQHYGQSPHTTLRS
ncbi:MAG: helix-turn-helix transcriptional regulator [Mycobacterium sp.]|uniref:helix-turn-helix transcriptional regulator n=1 Tax=Mycobacterium sp. TaxID=1785 RepID=UPI003899B104